MYKGKQVIIHRRPWWKHPVFPWGVYSLKMDKFDDVIVDVDGYFVTGDGGGGEYVYDWLSEDMPNGGTVIEPNELDGRFYRIYKGQSFTDAESLISNLRDNK